LLPLTRQFVRLYGVSGTERHDVPQHFDPKNVFADQRRRYDIQFHRKGEAELHGASLSVSDVPERTAQD
jgi:hypothetical protein